MTPDRPTSTIVDFDAIRARRRTESLSQRQTHEELSLAAELARNRYDQTREAGTFRSAPAAARRDAVLATVCLPGVLSGIAIAALYGSAGLYFAVAGAVVVVPLLAYLIMRAAAISIDADGTGVRIRNPYRTYTLTWKEIGKVERSAKAGPYGSRIPVMLFRTNSGKTVKARAARLSAIQGDWDVEQVLRLAPGHVAIRSEPPTNR